MGFFGGQNGAEFPSLKIIYYSPIINNNSPHQKKKKIKKNLVLKLLSFPLLLQKEIGMNKNDTTILKALIPETEILHHAIKNSPYFTHATHFPPEKRPRHYSPKSVKNHWLYKNPIQQEKI